MLHHYMVQLIQWRLMKEVVPSNSFSFLKFSKTPLFLQSQLETLNGDQTLPFFSESSLGLFKGLTVIFILSERPFLQAPSLAASSLQHLE